MIFIVRLKTLTRKVELNVIHQYKPTIKSIGGPYEPPELCYTGMILVQISKTGNIIKKYVAIWQLLISSLSR